MIQPTRTSERPLTRRCHLSRYSSHSLSAGDPPGTAILSGYGGDFRGVCFYPPPCPLGTFSDPSRTLPAGVYFNPQLPDGLFRQYAVLPLF